MTDLLAAVPLEAWTAGLLAAAIGGLAAALHHVPDGEHVPHPDTVGDLDADDDPDDTDPDLIDLDPIWDTDRWPGAGFPRRKEGAL